MQVNLARDGVGNTPVLHSDVDNVRTVGRPVERVGTRMSRSPSPATLFPGAVQSDGARSDFALAARHLMSSSKEAALEDPLPRLHPRRRHRCDPYASRRVLRCAGPRIVVELLHDNSGNRLITGMRAVSDAARPAHASAPLSPIDLPQCRTISAGTSRGDARPPRETDLP